MKKLLYLSFITTCCTAFCACAPFHPGNKKAAICNELNSKLVFNSAAPDARATDIQYVQNENLRRTYREYGCGTNQSVHHPKL